MTFGSLLFSGTDTVAADEQSLLPWPPLSHDHRGERGEPVGKASTRAMPWSLALALHHRVEKGTLGLGRPRFSLPSSPSPPPPRWTRHRMREYHGPQHQKAKTSGACYFCPSVPAGPHPLLVDPGHENTACRRVAPVAAKCQVSSFTLDAQPTHPSSRVLQHQQSGGHSSVCSCRNASSSRTSSPPRHHSAGSLAPPAPPTETTNITASNSIPPEFTTPITGRSQAHQDQQEPHQTNAKKKKGVPQSGSNPPIPPDRKHLCPTHAPAPHLPCRRAVPFPSTHRTTNLTSSSSPRTPHPRKEPSQEEGESNRHVCLCRACMLACSSR